MSHEVNNATATTAPGSFEPASASLSSEDLMMYLQVQLGSMDTEIQTSLAQQTYALKQREALSKVEEIFNKHNPPKDYEDWTSVKKDVSDAMKELAADDPVRKQVQEVLNDISQKHVSGAPAPQVPAKTPEAVKSAIQKKTEATGNAQFKFSMTADEWKISLSSIQQARENVKSNADLEMVQLQSMMSQRQTCIQLATNIMSKMNQSYEAIVHNIK
ncbi:MAG TPA: hypothetical protein VGJ84_12950 [Polyangiaceae bacterium]|jgi:hypothetical protein